MHSFFVLLGDIALSDLLLPAIGFVVAIIGFFLKRLFDRVDRHDDELKKIELEYQPKRECLCNELQNSMNQFMQSVAVNHPQKSEIEKLGDTICKRIDKLESSIETGFTTLRREFQAADEKIWNALENKQDKK